MLRVMTWNIRHGGGAKGMPRIALELVEQAADIIILTEFRQRTGGQIRGALADHGWIHQAHSHQPSRANSVLIASRIAIEPIETPRGLAGRWLACEIPSADVWLAGLHIPCDGPETGRKAFWHTVLRFARERAEMPGILIGDFNTGRHYLDEKGATFSDTIMMGFLSTAGYIDAWRHLHPDDREYSWFSHLGGGFRIDHALVSRPLGESIRAAWYSHEERLAGTSDHSSLMLVLERSTGPVAGKSGPHPPDQQEFAQNLRVGT